MSKIFLDTNILVYTVDHNDPAKMNEARQVLADLRQDGSPVISTQVMQEFYVTVTQKLHVDPLMAKRMLGTFATLEKVLIDEELINEAIDCSILDQLSFWDALIVVSAKRARCTELWTEDLSHGQLLRGVKVQNPLLSR